MNGSAKNDNVPSGVQGVCPSGWHIPSDAEWKILEIYLGLTQSQADAIGLRGTNEGGKLKEIGVTYWTSPNNGATNSSGFTAMPGGVRDLINGSFYGRTESCWLLSSSHGISSIYSMGREFRNDVASIQHNNCHKSNGISVRCVKD